ncbi:HPF/RaiA family ribosome-associated protein [Candidatus Babeliales bacterium]|nr:HPF/RaiA family ribosome-associated protein [Candidatus Babeliales bacterium]
MQLEIIFRGTEPSQAMEAYVIKYVEKFKKYMSKEDPESVFVHVVLEGHHNHHIMNVEVRVKSQHYDLVVDRDGADMYPLIDETMKIMEEELQQHKQRMVDDLRKRKKCC